jgi:regulator of sigma E protease
MFGGIIVAILALSVMVFVHEFFHLLVAKLSSMNAPVFSIGLGPKLFSFFKWGETDFRVSAIPFGGYVEIKGMEPDQMTGDEDEFYSKNVLEKTAVVFAGPFANFSLGFLIFFFVILFNGIEVPSSTTIKKANKESNLLENDKIISMDGKAISNWYEITQKIKNNSKVSLIRDGKETEIVVDSIKSDSIIPLIPPVVGKVLKNLPAEKAGIKKGDRILKIQEKPINGWEDITSSIYPSAEETLSIVFVNGEDTIKTELIPENQKSVEGDSIINRGIIGIEAPTEKINIVFTKAFILAGEQSWDTALWIYRSISWLFQRKVSPRDLAGAVGIVVYTKKSMEMGVVRLLMFIALITINLAVVNLIPIPPLDGFHILMSIATFNSKNPPSKKMLQVVQTIGTFVLISLMVLLLFNDIIRLIQRKF